eukprot:231452-Prymnesium_polylepis.1
MAGAQPLTQVKWGAQNISTGPRASCSGARAVTKSAVSFHFVTVGNHGCWNTACSCCEYVTGNGRYVEQRLHTRVDS